MRCRSWAIVFSPVLGIGPVYKSSSLDHTFSPVKSVPDDALMCGVIVNVWLFVSCFVFRALALAKMRFGRERGCQSCWRNSVPKGPLPVQPKTRSFFFCCCIFYPPVRVIHVSIFFCITSSDMLVPFGYRFGNVEFSESANEGIDASGAHGKADWDLGDYSRECRGSANYS